MPSSVGGSDDAMVLLLSVRSLSLVLVVGMTVVVVVVDELTSLAAAAVFVTTTDPSSLSAIEESTVPFDLDMTAAVANVVALVTNLVTSSSVKALSSDSMGLE